MDVIETERLLLEPLDIARLEDFVALTADPDTMRYWAPGGPFRRDVAERNFAASLARVREHGFGRRWIVAKENGAGLGFTDTKYFGESCDDVHIQNGLGESDDRPQANHRTSRRR